MIKDSEITQTLQANQQLLLQQHAALIQNLQKKIANTLSDDIDYVPVRGGFSFQSRPTEEVDVNTFVQQYLNSERKVLLLLGDSGAGKSLYCQQLVKDLWMQYQANPAQQPLPLLIGLPQLKNPTKTAIEETLQGYGLSAAEIKLLKQHQSFVFILDGYDEIRQTKNLYMTNGLSEWRAKTIITCRSQYLFTIEHYEPYFMPYKQEQVQGWLFSQLIIKPFNQAQIEKYLQQYVQHHTTVWSDWRLYLKHIETIPGLKQLIQTPFLLKIAVEAMPEIVTLYAQQPEQRLQLTQAKLYDVFVEQWFTRQAEKLKDNGQLKDDATFKAKLWTYAKALAKAMHQQNVTHIAYEETSDLFEENTEDNVWANFFSDDKEIQLLRSASLVQKIGVNQYAFFHSSLIEYFITRELYEETKVFADTHNNSTSEKTSVVTVPTQPTQKSQIETVSNTNSTQSITNPGFSATNLPTNYRYFNQRLLTDEAGMLQFLADRVTESEAFKQDMFKMIEGSKHDPNMKVGAANAISALNKAGLSFATLNLSGVRIPHADLSYSNCDHANFESADLSHVNFTQTWLREANFNHANMQAINLGQWPWLEHDKEVKAIAYHPQGKYLATAAGEIVKLWDLESQSLWKEFKDHAAKINGIAFSGNGQQLVSGSDDKTVKIWNIETGQAKTLRGHADKVLAVAFSSDSSTIASSSLDDVLMLWNLQSDQQQTLQQNKKSGEATTLAFSSHGKYLVAGIGSNLKIWELSNLQVKEFTGHSHTVNSVAFSPDEQHVASVSNDRTVRLWDLTTGQAQIMSGHSDSIHGVAFSPDGMQLASASNDLSVRLWNLATGQSQILKSHTQQVKSVAFSPDGKQIASGGSDYKVYIQDLVSFQPTALEQPHKGKINALVTSPDGTKFASCSDDTSIKIWDRSSRQNYELKGHTDWVTSLAFSPDGKFLLSGSKDKTIRLWDMSNGKDKLLASPNKNSVIEAVAYSPDSKYVAAALFGSGNDNEIVIWSVVNGRPRTFKGHYDIITYVKFSPDSKYLVSGSHDGTVRIWNIETGKAKILSGHEGGVNAIAFLDNQNKLAIATSNSEQTSVYEWDLNNSSLLKTHIVEGSISFAKCMAFSPDGKYLATGSETIVLWNLSTSEIITQLQGTQGEVNSLIFDLDRENRYRLITGTADGNLKEWCSITSSEQDPKAWYQVWSSQAMVLELGGITIDSVQGLVGRNHKLIESRLENYKQTNISALLVCSNAKRRLGLYEQAVKHCEQALLIEPNDSEIYNNMALAKNRLHLIAEAKSNYTRALELKPDNQYVYCNRAFVNYDLGCYQEAIIDFTETIARDNDKDAIAFYHSTYYSARGLCNALIGDFEAAIADGENALRLAQNQKDLFVRGRYAVIMAAQKNKEQASFHLANMSSFDENEYWINYFKGCVASLLANYEEAIKYFDKNIQAQTDETDFSSLAICYAWRGYSYCHIQKKELALKDLAKALERIPEHQQWQLWQQQILVDALPTFTQKINANSINQIEKIIPVEESKNESEPSNYFEKEVKHQDEVIKLNPTNHKAFSERGYAKARIGQYEGAISDFTQALNLNSDGSDYSNQEFSYKYRYLAKMALGHYEEVIADCIQVNFYMPEDELCLHSGDAKRYLGRYNEAIADYSKSIKESFDFSDSLCNTFMLRALTKVQIGDEKGAWKDSQDGLRHLEKSFISDKSYVIGHYAVVLAYLKNSKDALAKLNDVKPGTDDGYAWSKYIEGWVNHLLGQHQRAIDCFNEVFKLNVVGNSLYPGFDFNYLSASYALCGWSQFQMGDANLAQANLVKALAYIPNHPEWKKWLEKVLVKTTPKQVNISSAKVKNKIVPLQTKMAENKVIKNIDEPILHKKESLTEIIKLGEYAFQKQQKPEPIKNTDIATVTILPKELKAEKIVGHNFVTAPTQSTNTLQVKNNNNTSVQKQKTEIKPPVKAPFVAIQNKPTTKLPEKANSFQQHSLSKSLLSATNSSTPLKSTSKPNFFTSKAKTLTKSTLSPKVAPLQAVLQECYEQGCTVKLNEYQNNTIILNLFSEKDLGESNLQLLNQIKMAFVQVLGEKSFKSVEVQQSNLTLVAKQAYQFILLKDIIREMDLSLESSDINQKIKNNL